MAIDARLRWVKRVMEAFAPVPRPFMCLALGLLGLLPTLGTGCGGRDPDLAGRPLSFWESQLVRPAGQRHPNTADVLAAAPETSLPALRRRLLAKDGPLRRLLVNVSEAFPRLGLAVSSNDLGRRGAAEVLAAHPGLGIAAAEALTGALAMSRRRDASEAVQQALIRIGPSAIPHLLRVPSDGDESTVPRRVFRTLAQILREAGQVGEFGPELAGAARRHLGSRDAEVVLAATEILTRLGRTGEIAIPEVLENLRRHSLPTVRAASAKAAGAITGHATAERVGRCVQALASALDDQDDEVRISAAIALGRFGEAAAGAVGPLMHLAQESGTRSAIAAANALGRIGPPAAESVPALIANLRRPEPIVRASGAGALGRIHAAPEASVPALAALLGDPDSYVRQAAATALEAFGAEAEVAVPELIAALRDPVESVRISAARALGSIGESASDAAPALRAARNNNQSVMTGPVVEALARIEAGRDERENP